MSAPLCRIPGAQLTAADLVASDQFRGQRFKLYGGGLEFDDAAPGVGPAGGLIRLRRSGEAGKAFAPRYVVPSQPVYLIPRRSA